MRCLLNIWGVMLFLRLSWVVGEAGNINYKSLKRQANITVSITHERHLSGFDFNFNNDCCHHDNGFVNECHQHEWYYKR